MYKVNESNIIAICVFQFIMHVIVVVMVLDVSVVVKYKPFSHAFIIKRFGVVEILYSRHILVLLLTSY
jgi:hypothetical protein